VVLHATFVDLHGDGVLGLRYRGLRGEGHLEQRALDGGDGVGADDDGAGAVAEQSLAEDVVGAASLGTRAPRLFSASSLASWSDRPPP
jgi:hypothetical protein